MVFNFSIKNKRSVNQFHLQECNLTHAIESSCLCFIIVEQIPALAVEMPGSADIPGLNLQFGALQFGSEPVLPEYDTSAVATSTPGNATQNSLYTSANRFHSSHYVHFSFSWLFEAW